MSILTTMDTISLSVAGGFRIVVPADPTVLSTYVFLEFEDWFEDEAPFLRTLFAPGDRVLDVGANLGFYALTAARKAGARGRVWCFEPTPDVAQNLRASLAMNQMATATVIEAALGGQRGRAGLVRGGSAEMNRIDEAATGAEQVVMETLDGWYADTPEARGISFVKLDVEGHEDAVIAGGAAFFTAESPLVMMEVSDDPAGTAAAIARLEAMGYRGFRLLPGPGILVPHDGPRADPFMINLFLAKPDRIAALEARGLLARALVPPPLADMAALEAYLCALPALAPHADRIGVMVGRVEADGILGVALRAWIASRDAARTAAERASSLLLSAEAIERALEEANSASRRLSAGRILREAGLRAKASAAVRDVVEALVNRRPLTLGEPFLPVMPAYETWTSPGGMQGWVAAMALEARWCWDVFSLRIGQPDFGPNDPVTLLANLGRKTAFVERRRMLLARLAGQDARPDPMLLQAAPDNLNPEYWAGQPLGPDAVVPEPEPEPEPAPKPEPEPAPEAETAEAAAAGPASATPGKWRIRWPWRAR